MQHAVEYSLTFNILYTHAKHIRTHMRNGPLASV